MYQIYKYHDSSYIIKTSTRNVPVSSLKDLVLVMKALGSNFSEIEYGLSEMVRNDHNYADYGVNKMFIFSCKKHDMSSWHTI